MNTLCEQYLHILYQHPSPDFTPASIAQTSGEILYTSIGKLIPLMQLTADDIFVDLGSATGKITSQIFLMTPVKAAIGIEIVPELHAIAMDIAHRIRSDFFENEREIKFICDDFLKMSLDNMTVALINAMCFPDSLVQALGNKINETQSIRTVFSLRPLVNLTRLKLRKILPVECSWDTALCYWYEVSDTFC